MENVAKWHHGVPTKEQYEEAMKELDEQINAL
jgi:transketolase